MPKSTLPGSRYNAEVSDIADRFGLSERTIRRYIASGRITAYRVGPRAIRLDPDEVERQLLDGSRIGGVA